MAADSGKASDDLTVASESIEADLVKDLGNLTVGPGPREVDFVRALDNLTVKPEMLEPHRPSDNCFAVFPVFALSAQVSEADLQQAARVFNDQAQALLCFNDKEFAGLGYYAAVPEHWQLHKKTALDEETTPDEHEQTTPDEHEQNTPDEQTALDAAHRHLEEFDKTGSGTAKWPQWFPFGFLGIISNNWRETGVVSVFYNIHSDEPLEDKSVPVVAFVANPEQVGEMLIALRQCDELIDGLKMAGSGYTMD
jgi:hypothetical protein